MFSDSCIPFLFDCRVTRHLFVYAQDLSYRSTLTREWKTLTLKSSIDLRLEGSPDHEDDLRPGGDPDHEADGLTGGIPDHEEERRAADEFAWNNCVSAVHSPHRLEPITERNSLATLQTKGSRASCQTKGPTRLPEKESRATLQSRRQRSNQSLRPQPSTSTLLNIPSVQPTHRKSFSLPSFSRRSNKSSSSSVTLTPGGILNALPRVPKRPPPERRPTPPGAYFQSPICSFVMFCDLQNMS